MIEVQNVRNDDVNQIDSDLESLSIHAIQGLAFELALKFHIVKSDNCFVYMDVGSGSECYFISIHEQSCQQIFRLFAESKNFDLGEVDRVKGGDR